VYVAWNGYLLRRSGPRFYKCTLRGTDIFYVDRVRGFLSVRCVIVELLESLSGLCVPVQIDSVEVSRQAMIRAGVACGGRFVVQALPVGRYQVVYCVAVNM